MSVGMRTLAVMVAMMVAVSVRAQTVDLNDKAFAYAATIVLGHDLLAARCLERLTFSSEASATIDAWVRDNEVERIRARTRELEQDPSQKRQLDMVRRMFSLPFSAKGQAACNSAVTVARRDDAQFSRNSPQMIATLRTRSGVVATTPMGARDSGGQTRRNGDVASAPTPAPPVVVATPVSTGSSSAIVARIDRFGFDTRAAMGVGGFITTDIYPIVLFRDGIALTDVEGLAFAGGLDAYRRVHPEDWTRWRREGLEYQLEKKGKWERIAFRKTYATLPAGFRLSGRFQSLSGTGNVAVGGTASVTVVSDYSFDTNGRVVRGGASGSSTSAGGASVVTSNVAASRRGHYAVEGVTLRIRYDDGSQEQRILVTDPDDPKSAIWLDGRSYVHR